MKTRSPVIIAAGFALALSACIPSLNPYFTPKDLVADARLVGQWQADDESMIWNFEDAGEKGYTLAVTEKETKHGTFAAHLFKIGDDMFLDLIATKCEFAPDQTDLVSMSVFPGHLLVRVTSIDPALKIAFIDWDWLKKFLDANPGALAHHIENQDQIILTAETKDLQRFIAKHLGQGELFGDVATMMRIPTTHEASPPEAAAKP